METVKRIKKISNDDDVFVILRVDRVTAVKVRKIVHTQEWYDGDDVILEANQQRDYMELEVAGLLSELRGYWTEWKSRAKLLRERREKGEKWKL